MKQLHLGSLAGAKIIVLPVAFLASLLLWILFSAIAFAALHMSLGLAVAVGLVAMLLHWLSEVVHHLGHAIAAKRTGYPMQSIVLGGIQGYLALSSYPADEPKLPDSLHIRRAVGGPIASLLFTLIFGVCVLLVPKPFWWVAILLFIENLIFTVQLFIPLGKLLDNDGNTLYRWLRGRGKTEIA